MPPEADVSEDAVLGGRLRLRQLREGHRFGHDAVLLAAACPGRPGERVADLGAGVGAAGLALATRIGGIRVTLVEIDPRLAALAKENVESNRLAERVNVVVLDVLAPADAYAAAGLPPGSLTRVLMNPPFNDPGRQRASPNARRRLAHTGRGGTLPEWLHAAGALLGVSGTVTLMWRADALDHVLQSLPPVFGGAAVLPVYPKPGQAAIRVIVRGSKGSRGKLALLPGLTLNDAGGLPSAEAQSVLREGAILPIAQVTG
jgi:tRNA1(Val) A37 N6-methylase TrmN6